MAKEAMLPKRMHFKRGKDGMYKNIKVIITFKEKIAHSIKA